MSQSSGRFRRRVADEHGVALPMALFALLLLASLAIAFKPGSYAETSG